MASDEGNGRNEMWTHNKEVAIQRWNRSSYSTLALSASWTNGLIAKSLRASERNLVVLGSNSTQANFL